MYSAKYYNFDLSSSEYKFSAKIISESVDLISKKIRNQERFYKIFSDLSVEKHILPYIDLANHIKQSFSDLIVISMGGALLNPQSILSLCMPQNTQSTPKIHFLHNTDPFFFQNLIANIELKNCAVLIISNSGETSEVLFLTSLIIKTFQDYGCKDLSSRFFFITSSLPNSLKTIATEVGATIILHEQDISGRFAGLSNVSTLPAMIAGIDAVSYLEGATKVLEDFLLTKEISMPAKGAIALYSLNKPIMVNIGYLQRFLPFLQWQTQIIAESLGKDRKGYTPIYGLGPNEQHTTMQLYLDGPNDKTYSLFYVENMERISKINSAHFKATSMSLIEKQLPVREILLSDLSAKSVGALVCHFMLEIILLGILNKVNPFDQPGVELIKSKVRDIIN